MKTTWPGCRAAPSAIGPAPCRARSASSRAQPARHSNSALRGSDGQCRQLWSSGRTGSGKNSMPSSAGPWPRRPWPRRGCRGRAPPRSGSCAPPRGTAGRRTRTWLRSRRAACAWRRPVRHGRQRAASRAWAPPLARLRRRAWRAALRLARALAMRGRHQRLGDLRGAAARARQLAALGLLVEGRAAGEPGLELVALLAVEPVADHEASFACSGRGAADLERPVVLQRGDALARLRARRSI